MKRIKSKRLLAFFVCFVLVFTALQPGITTAADINKPTKPSTQSDTTFQSPSTDSKPIKVLPIKPLTPDETPSVQPKPFESLPLEDIFIAPKIKTGEEPATFNVNYSLQDNVVIAENKLGDVLRNLMLPEEIENNIEVPGLRKIDKLKKSALISQDIFAAKIPDYEKGKIYFDKANGVAVKTVENLKLRRPDGTGASNFISLKNPDPNEVFKDFQITRQTIELTKGNISGYARGVEESLIKRSNNLQLDQSDAGSYMAYNGRMQAGMFGKSAVMGRYVPKHISDPLVEFDFKNIPLAAFDEDGDDIEITLDGYLGIDGITVDAEYGFSGEYYFAVKTAEEANLTVNVEIETDKHLLVPIYGIDIDAEVARITGGLFLVVDVNGNVEIVVSVTQWAKVRAGVGGSTLLYIPSPPKPIFDLYENQIEVDVSLAGEISLELKAGIILDLEILGWECVGAEALAGAAVECRANDLLLDLTAYFVIDVNATLFGSNIDICCKKWKLYQTQKPNTRGYRIMFNEVCAYRDNIWGHIAKWTGASEEEGVKNYQGVLEITCRRTEDPNAGMEETYLVFSDANGNFKLLDTKNKTGLNGKKFDLRKHDFVWVSKVGGEEIGPVYVTTTFPFSHVEMDYADFFNEEAKGYVGRAKVRKWPADEYEYIDYTGDVQLIVDKRHSQEMDIPMPMGKCNDKGEFLFGYPLYPYHEVSAKLISDGFEVESWNIVRPDVDFIGKRIIETVERKAYEDGEGKTVEQRSEIEHFLVINRRGKKCLDAPGHYGSHYFIFSPFSYCYEPISGYPVVPPKEIGKKEFDGKILPTGDNNGTSVIVKNFTTEWGWNGYINEGESSTLIGQLQQVEGLSSQLQLRDWKSQIKLKEDLMSQISIVPLSFRYDSEYPKPEEDSFMDISKMVGLNSVVRKGFVTFYIKGEKVEVYDPEDIEKRGKGRKMAHINNPVAEMMMQRFWNRVNPSEFDDGKEIIKNPRSDRWNGWMDYMNQMNHAHQLQEQVNQMNEMTDQMNQGMH